MGALERMQAGALSVLWGAFVSRRWAHARPSVPGLEERGSKMADTAHMTAPKEHGASALARVDGKALFHRTARGTLSRPKWVLGDDVITSLGRAGAPPRGGAETLQDGGAQTE